MSIPLPQDLVRSWQKYFSNEPSAWTGMSLRNMLLDWTADSNGAWFAVWRNGQRDRRATRRATGRLRNIYGQGGTTLSITNIPDGTLSEPEAFTSPGGAGQGYGFDYDGGTSAVFGNSFLTPGTVSGLEALLFDGGGTNLLDDGGRFVSSVIIDGDWSNPASHTAATFASGYSVDDDFTYDSISNGTTFSVETEDYVADGFSNPAISFALLGDPVGEVPEPMTLALFGAGLVGAVAMRRRKAKRA